MTLVCVRACMRARGKRRRRSARGCCHRECVARSRFTASPQVRAANQVEKRGAGGLANLKIHRILLLKLGVGGLWLLIAP